VYQDKTNPIHLSTYTHMRCPSAATTAIARRTVVTVPGGVKTPRWIRKLSLDIISDKSGNATRVVQADCVNAVRTEALATLTISK